jgi:hypothetical protein
MAFFWVQMNLFDRPTLSKDSMLLSGESGREMFNELVATIGINSAQGAEKLTAQQSAHQLDFSNGKVRIINYYFNIFF